MGDVDDRDKERSFKLRAQFTFCVAALAALLICVGAWFTWAVLNDRSDERTNRDRIAACVKSNDVVGCLKEAR